MMSDRPDSFSAEWLALREPADHAARDPGLAERAASLLAGRDVARIVDLGCGAGSNLRGFAPFMKTRQHWTLVDHDPALLAAARKALVQWADASRDDDATLRLDKAGRDISVDFVEADLAQDFSRALDRDADLVTAAALFDLASDAWLDRFCDALAARRLPLYTVLIYNGREDWSPAHRLEVKALAAFHAHMRSDKSFGPALGPASADALARKLEARGYVVALADSPWRLRVGDALLGELATGAAGAVAETGALAPAEWADWRDARMKAQSAVIGHRDLLAVPR